MDHGPAGPGGDLGVDAPAGAVCDGLVDGLVVEALVGKGSADGSVGLFGDLVQREDARGVAVGVRGGDDDRDDRVQDVHRQVAESPLEHS
ncbi:hypothetical protein [Streptomyces nitrosporeus]|uniref:hypothetical protein n=1 Tax=Streptomyces nitrosporeus TaxID=28894 RepID=UPI0033333E90